MDDDQPAPEPDAKRADKSEHHDKPAYSRRSLVLLVGPIVVLAIVGTVTSALTPTLAADHPLLLITLEARNRNLILAREVDLMPFFVVAILRRMLTDPLYFILGHRYGDASVRWLEKKAGFGPLATWLERVFPKAAYPLVFLFPGAIVCALAGASGMSVAGFMIANFLGTIAAVTAVRLASDAVASPIESLVDFFERNKLETTLVTIGLVVLSIVLAQVQGKLDPGVDELEEEIEKEAAAGSPGEGGGGSGGGRAGGGGAGSDVEQGVEADGEAGQGRH